MVTDTKTCTKCGATKPVSDFYKKGGGTYVGTPRV